MKSLICSLFLLSSVFLHSTDLSLKRKEFYVGPEYTHVVRKKEGGIEQNGDLFGLKFGFDRLKRYGWYWGADATYLKGYLSGSSEDITLRSCFIDTELEARLGYTFQCKASIQPSWTPFIGGGYISERNNFTAPSPIHVHFETRFGYLTTGFLSWCHPFQCLEVGLNFKIRWPLDPYCQVSHDPDNDPIRQTINPELHYKVELPITYRITCDGRFALTLNPFYEYRHYGHQVNFPFDFVDTKIHFIGLNLYLLYRFW